ncbi:biotin synthase BioB [Sulfurivermis fontis]|uniref:biotin synthase BioB n=1 Tax=Sulfurivermis fontis TaxID=1972068 RepID=UPI000FDB0937|nr:biotin synthase BioB [Sulfurivermis fontis]
MPQAAHRQAASDLRHDWKVAEVEALFSTPFMELLFQAQQVHRRHFDPSVIQASSLLNIKTGGCAENCGYCSQSAHHEKKVKLERDTLMEVDVVVAEAQKAKDSGATRFCMGAAWRNPRDEQLDVVLEMIRQVKAMGLETCVTLGMLTAAQVAKLKEAGLDYYNHNLDTSREYYDKVVTTRTYDERLDTLAEVRKAGINVCAGGIMGMGESRTDRAALLAELANLPEHPQSVPINLLVKVPGTPLADSPDLDIFEFIRTIAVARIIMPQSYVRLSAGRQNMHDEAQALCFLAGANSIFYGDRLLTTDNATINHDRDLFRRLDLTPAA